jgi:hypothetical protein
LTGGKALDRAKRAGGGSEAGDKSDDGIGKTHLNTSCAEGTVVWIRSSARRDAKQDGERKLASGSDEMKLLGDVKMAKQEKRPAVHHDRPSPPPTPHLITSPLVIERPQLHVDRQAKDGP